MCKLTTSSSFDFLQDIPPLKHQSIARSSEKKRPFERPQTQNVLKVFVFETQFETDALA